MRNEYLSKTMARRKKLNLNFKYIIIFVVLAVIIVSFYTGGEITGLAPSDTATLSITLGNTAPTVWNVTSPDNEWEITEGGPGSTGIIEMVVNFTGCDDDGVANLEDDGAALRVNVTNAEFRDNDTTTAPCKWIEDDADTYCAHYSCNVSIYYYDTSGSWTMNASIVDVNNARAYNLTNTTDLKETAAMLINVTGLTFPALTLGDENVTANNDPLGINNTGNKNIGSGNVQVTAYALQGVDNQAHELGAINFTVHTASTGDGCSGGTTCTECNAGTRMVDSAATGVVGSIINKGDLDSGPLVGKEELFFCLNRTDQDLIAQTYDTTNTNDWTIGVV